jgi:hypothetical protein
MRTVHVVKVTRSNEVSGQRKIHITQSDMPRLGSSIKGGEDAGRDVLLVTRQ